jgi:hypothetical protein
LRYLIIVKPLKLYFMPTNDLINSQLDPATLLSCVNQLVSVQSTLIPFGQNLTPEERQRYGSINEQNKLLVGKVRDFHNQQPNLASPDVNWTTFEQNWISRSGFEQLENICKGIIELCSDARILHDYSLFQNALVDYDYSKYKANSTQGGGSYSTKVEEIKQFFPNTGGSNNTPNTPKE